jgi:hypothetical protein
MADIPTSIIKWGKKLIDFKEYDNSDSNDNGNGDDDGYISLQFEDGEVSKASLLVAADGIYSTIRSKLFPSSSSSSSLSNDNNNKLNYLGVMVILGISPLVFDSNLNIISNTNSDSNNNDDDLKYRRTQFQWLDGDVRVFCMYHYYHCHHHYHYHYHYLYLYYYYYYLLLLLLLLFKACLMIKAIRCCRCPFRLTRVPPSTSCMLAVNG